MSQPVESERRREGGRGRRRRKVKVGKVKKRKTSVFTDPISTVPQQSSIQTDLEH